MLKILTISNDRIFSKAFERLLNTRFPDLVKEMVNGGFEVFDKINSFEPGLIFIDGTLTEESGFPLAESIKKQFSYIAVAIFTNYDVPEYHEAARKIGADHCMSKQTTSVPEILDLIERYLSNSDESMT